MDNRVYYGEYSLEHWLDLILRGNILLPWYQRAFVWEKSQVDNLITTLDSRQFIPPIVIGAVKKNGEWKNYILDGQQRLTSILFAKVNRYIDTKEYLAQKPKAEISQIADDLPNDEDEEFSENVKIINWNFSEIIKNRKVNSQELEKSYFKELLGEEKPKEWFNKRFLGFAYIKPSNSIDEEQQSKFYSDIFRNINIGGTKLTRLETRKSLYFLKEDLKNFFAPEFLNNYKVETSSRESGLVDFIKYLSIISQVNGSHKGIVQYGGRMWEKNENYYQKYIMAVVDQDSDNELKFDVSYPSIPYNNERIENFKTIISQLEIPKTFSSIIEMDLYFFGLVNEVIFLNKNLDLSKKDQLKIELNEKVNELKISENHKDNPHALKYLRIRINTSIDIYRKIELPNNE